MNHNSFALLFLLIASPLLLRPVSGAELADDVAAKVNAAEIDKDYFEKVYRQNQMFISDKVVTKEKVINDLINRELGLQKAREEKLHQNPVVREKIEDVLYHAQVSKDLEDEFKKIKVSDAEVKKYYQDHPEYRTAHILIRLPPDADKEAEAEAQRAAIEIYNQLKEDPEKFPEMANKYSQTSAAPNGGDIGFQPAFRLAPEYFEAIKGKKKGFFTPLVRTQFGYHIIKVLDVKKYAQINKEIYKKILYDKKRDKIMQAYFTKLRSNADIQINKEL